VDIFETALGGIAGGRVLDVATQEGGFVQILLENLNDWSEIVGIDIDARAIEAARSAVRQEGVQFAVMNAEQLDFADESFDTASISASLHHLSNVQRVLEEMRRVLKPGGHFIVAEMHRDGETEAELTSVTLHQWAAEVDSALGRLHNGTLSRQEIVDRVAGLELSDLELYDLVDSDSDPMDKARIEQLEGVIERIEERVEGVGDGKALRERGEELRRRLCEVGAQREPILVLVGRK
jgi:ubiquinone/menaquinone biosynthesis C-methylase UbiE